MLVAVEIFFSNDPFFESTLKIEHMDENGSGFEICAIPDTFDIWAKRRYEELITLLNWKFKKLLDLNQLPPISPINIPWNRRRRQQAWNAHIRSIQEIFIEKVEACCKKVWIPCHITMKDSSWII